MSNNVSIPSGPTTLPDPISRPWGFSTKATSLEPDLTPLDRRRLESEVLSFDPGPVRRPKPAIERDRDGILSAHPEVMLAWQPYSIPFGDCSYIAVKHGKDGPVMVYFGSEDPYGVPLEDFVGDLEGLRDLEEGRTAKFETWDELIADLRSADEG